MFSLFTIVTFPNAQCTAKSDSTMYGTCYAESECTAKSGTVDGNCAAGFGVCCTFASSTCGSTVTQNCTYIQNPSYPSTYATTGSCGFTVTPLSTDICQLRLDFDVFDLVDAATGVCTDNLAMVGPTGRNPYALCGTLTGDHVYVEQGRSSSNSVLTFTTASTTGIKWKIKISQIECSSRAKAPEGCNQYFTGNSGTFNSFNWPTVALQSQIVSYCIRKEKGYCGVQYSAYSAASPDTFQLDNAATTTNLNGPAAPEGHLLIPGGVGLVDTFSGGVFCDETTILCAANPAAAIAVGGTVSRNAQTNKVYHVSAAVDQTGNVGFKMQYTQLPCTSGTNVDQIGKIGAL